MSKVGIIGLALFLGPLAVAILIWAVDAQANSREADVSNCMANHWVPVVSASSHMQVVCIDPVAVKWVR